MRARWWMSTALSGLALLGLGLPGAAASEEPMIGQAAPTFRLTSLAGEAVDLADLKGKIVVLHFGAGW